jgi:hypothetical protein
MDARKEELEKKRQKLAELRRAREERKAAFLEKEASCDPRCARREAACADGARPRHGHDSEESERGCARALEEEGVGTRQFALDAPMLIVCAVFTLRPDSFQSHPLICVAGELFLRQ